MSAVPMNHMAVLRLEVENDYPGVANLTVNPTGDLGGWGWTTPATSTALDGVLDGGAQTIVVKPTASVATFFYGEPVPCNSSQWAGASWIAYAAGSPGAATGNERHKARLEFLDNTGAFLGAGATTGYLAYDGTRKFLTQAQAPANTASVRLVIWLYADNAGTNPVANVAHKFRQVMIGTASTAAAVTNLAYAAHPGWTNILAPAHSIRAARTPMGVNTLAATILSTTLDPATSVALRPDHKLRLQALDYTTSTWKNVVPPSRIEQAVVTYDLDAPVGKNARIEVVALDAGSDLANAPYPAAHGNFPDARLALEGAGVPWRVGSPATLTGHSGSAPVSTYPLDTNATARDSVILTRDRYQSGVAFIDRDGIFLLGLAVDFGFPSATPSFTTADFSDIGIGFDTADVVNQAEVTALETSGTSTPATYERTPSRRQWGARKVSFTYLGTPTIAQAHADDVFDTHAAPTRRVRSMRIPITSPSKITSRLAFIDLYQPRAVDYPAKGISDQWVRPVSISHEITPNGWLVDLEFAGYDHWPLASDA